MIIRRYVLESEQGKILQECHASPYGGHFAGDKTAHKILQSGFYWLTIFKDCFEWVKISVKGIKCPRMVSWWCNYLMYEEQNSWGLFHLLLEIYTYS